MKKLEEILHSYLKSRLDLRHQQMYGMIMINTLESTILVSMFPVATTTVAVAFITVVTIRIIFRAQMVIKILRMKILLMAIAIIIILVKSVRIIAFMIRREVLKARTQLA